MDAGATPQTCLKVLGWDQDSYDRLQSSTASTGYKTEKWISERRVHLLPQPCPHMEKNRQSIPRSNSYGFPLYFPLIFNSLTLEGFFFFFKFTLLRCVLIQQEIWLFRSHVCQGWFLAVETGSALTWNTALNASDGKNRDSQTSPLKSWQERFFTAWHISVWS